MMSDPLLWPCLSHVCLLRCFVCLVAQTWILEERVKFSVCTTPSLVPSLGLSDPVGVLPRRGSVVSRGV